MSYIVFIPKEDPFITQWMSDEMFPETAGSVVVNLANGMFTRDGKHWDFMEEDHL